MWKSKIKININRFKTQCKYAYHANVTTMFT